MRNNYRAYADFSSAEKGCCLSCDNAETGCLCYDCKCRKCAYYLKRGEDFGVDDFMLGGVRIGLEKEGVCEIANGAKSEAISLREQEEEERADPLMELSGWQKIGGKNGRNTR